MREFFLLPLVLITRVVVLPLAVLGIAFLCVGFLIAEGQGWARVGGVHQGDRDS